MNISLSNLHSVFKITVSCNGVKFVSSHYTPIVNWQEDVVVESEIYKRGKGIQLKHNIYHLMHKIYF